MNPQAWQELQATLRTVLGDGSWKDVLDLGPEDLAVLVQTARQMAEQGRLDEARTILEGLVVLAPREGYLHTALGCVYMRMGWVEDAVAAFQCALALDETDVAAHTYLGELYLTRGQVEAAVAHLQAAVERDPGGTDPYANRARLLSGLVAALARSVPAGGS